MSKQQYISDYNKKSYYSLLLRIPRKDKEILDKIESVQSKNGYVLQLIENDLHPSVLTLSFIKKELKEILGKHDIQKIYLFGSYARGEANCNSDVDILCEKGDITSLLQKESLEAELETKLQKKVDLVFTTSAMPDYFKETIQKDLIELC